MKVWKHVLTSRAHLTQPTDHSHADNFLLLLPSLSPFWLSFFPLSLSLFPFFPSMQQHATILTKLTHWPRMKCHLWTYVHAWSGYWTQGALIKKAPIIKSVTWSIMLTNATANLVKIIIPCVVDAFLCGVNYFLLWSEIKMNNEYLTNFFLIYGAVITWYQLLLHLA